MHEQDQALIEQFLDALWLERNLAENTLASYRLDLRSLAEWLARLGEGYTTVIRGIPDLVLILLIFYVGSIFSGYFRAGVHLRLRWPDLFDRLSGGLADHSVPDCLENGLDLLFAGVVAQ